MPAHITGSSTAVLNPISDKDQCDSNLQTVEYVSTSGKVFGPSSQVTRYKNYDVATPAPDTSSGIDLIAQLRVATSRLPSTVALATSADELAHFSGDPEEESQTYGDPWEMVDRALNRVVGYGRTTADIAGLVRRGPNGMDGLCNWLSVCIEKLDVDPALLEGKMKRLLDAVTLL